MDHPTSGWARCYGLPDPGPRARDVLDADPGRLASVGRRCALVAAAAGRGGERTSRAIDSLRIGWSTPAALFALGALASTARGVAEACAAMAAVIEEYAAAAGALRSQLLAAYAAADDAIAAGGLLLDVPAFPPDAFVRMVRERSAVVVALGESVATIADRVDSAALLLAAAIGPDPRGSVPAAWRRGFTLPIEDPAGRADARNRARLAADMASSSPQRRQFAAAVRNALEHAAADGHTVDLLSYDPDRPPGQGGASIAVGDVGSADSVAVLVPGVGNSPSDAAGALGAAAGLADAAAAASGTSGAAVVWLGYDVPLSWTHDPVLGRGMVDRALGDSALALSALDASLAGPQLADFCRRLRTMMDPTAGLTLVGHSYGSTVVSQAARVLGPGAGVDDIVLLGSPGAGYGPRRAEDYPAVAADHVYALAFPADPVAQPVTDLAASLANPFGTLALALGMGGGPGPFGADPGQAAFGAQIIDVPSGVPVMRGRPSLPLSILTGPAAGAIALLGADPIRNLDQHALGNYLAGPALGAVGAVVAGRYSQVPVRHRRR